MYIRKTKCLFRDREDAGRKLGNLLIKHELSKSVVAAIPRGGVPVGLESAVILKAQFDLIVVRKIPVPWEPEAGYGAVTQDGTVVLNEPFVERLGLQSEEIEHQAEDVAYEVRRRLGVFRMYIPPVELAGRTVVVVDDGLASGFTALAAVRSIRSRDAERVFVAVPVASRGAQEMLEDEADEVVAMHVAPEGSFAVADFYEHWCDLNDDEVVAYLMKYQTRPTGTTKG